MMKCGLECGLPPVRLLQYRTTSKKASFTHRCTRYWPTCDTKIPFLLLLPRVINNVRRCSMTQTKNNDTCDSHLLFGFSMFDRKRNETKTTCIFSSNCNIVDGILLVLPVVVVVVVPQPPYTTSSTYFQKVLVVLASSLSLSKCNDSIVTTVATDDAVSSTTVWVIIPIIIIIIHFHTATYIPSTFFRSSITKDGTVSLCHDGFLVLYDIDTVILLGLVCDSCRTVYSEYRDAL
jgi:hypothetical protein